MKFNTRIHTWNEDLSCIYLEGDPERKPQISGMLTAKAEDLCELLNGAFDLYSANPGGAASALGYALSDFVAENYGRNLWRPKSQPTDPTGTHVSVDAGRGMEGV